MKCINCTAEILPQYVHSIANNTCPGCGGSIYDDRTKELYNELKEAMIKMPNDPVGLTGWLLDNYKLEKIGDAAPVEKFYNQKEKIKVKEASTDKTNEFFQRAGVAPQTRHGRSKDYSSLVKQINNSVEDEMYGGEDQDEVEMGHEVDGSDIMAAQEMGAHFGDEELLIPGKPLARSEMMELKSMVSKAGPAKADAILESERMLRLQRQETMLSGGGGFKRQ